MGKKKIHKADTYTPSKTKVTRVEQSIPEELLVIQDDKIIKCYEHFKDRYNTRYKTTSMTYQEYIKVWVQYIRGKETHRDFFNLWTMIGHYIKDKHVYEVLYRKIFKYNIYVPLTIYEIEKPSTRCRKYKKTINIQSSKQNLEELTPNA
jgi:hypothetical protein